MNPTRATELINVIRVWAKHSQINGRDPKVQARWELAEDVYRDGDPEEFALLERLADNLSEVPEPLPFHYSQSVEVPIVQDPHEHPRTVKWESGILMEVGDEENYTEVLLSGRGIARFFNNASMRHLKEES